MTTPSVSGDSPTTVLLENYWIFTDDGSTSGEVDDQDHIYQIGADSSVIRGPYQINSQDASNIIKTFGADIVKEFKTRHILVTGNVVHRNQFDRFAEILQKTVAQVVDPTSPDLAAREASAKAKIDALNGPVENCSYSVLYEAVAGLEDLLVINSPSYTVADLVKYKIRVKLAFQRVVDHVYDRPLWLLQKFISDPHPTQYKQDPTRYKQDELQSLMTYVDTLLTDYDDTGFALPKSDGDELVLAKSKYDDWLRQVDVVYGQIKARVDSGAITSCENIDVPKILLEDIEIEDIEEPNLYDYVIAGYCPEMLRERSPIPITPRPALREPPPRVGPQLGPQP